MQVSTSLLEDHVLLNRKVHQQRFVFSKSAARRGPKKDVMNYSSKVNSSDSSKGTKSVFTQRSHTPGTAFLTSDFKVGGTF